MTNQPNSNSVYAVANGTTSTSPFIEIFSARDPGPSDSSYPVQKRWFNTISSNEWVLTGFTANNGVIAAIWQNITSGPGGQVDTLTGNSGGAVTPFSNNINVVGDGITITTKGNLSPDDHTLVISATGTLGVWTDEGTSFTAAPSMGYFTTAALTATLPTPALQGQTIDIAVDNAGTVIIQAAAGQKIRLANMVSGIAGTATSTAIGCSLQLVYRAANNEWFSTSTEGSWILT